MPYQGLSDGLYLLRQPSSKAGVYHFGVLDVGNRLALPWATAFHPVIAHQTPPSIRFDLVRDTGAWEMVGRILNEPAALRRLRVALNDALYDLFGNNCEHFARFVATGRRESLQLRTALVALCLTVLLVSIVRSETA